MTYQLKCPNCSKHLYFTVFGENGDFSESLCRSCQYKYTLQQTEIGNFISTVETKSSNTFTENTSYSCVYNLRLQQPNGTLKSLTFSTPGQAEKISGLAGDTILLLYTMRGKVLEDLVWLENLTTGKSHLLFHPGAKARLLGVNTAFLTLVANGLLAGLLHIPVNQFFWAAAIPGSIGVGVYVTKRSSIKVSDHAELRQLSSEQQLLAQKHELEQKITGFAQELNENQSIIQRLTRLQSKMISVGENLYASELVTVAKGINVIQKQLGLLQNLSDGYSQLIKVIEIEFETSGLVEQLPGDINEKIFKRLEELKTIQIKKEELALLFNPQQILAELHPERSLSKGLEKQ